MASDDLTFADLIRSLGSGRFHDEATEGLSMLVKEMTRVAESSGGKPKGQLTLTIKLQLDRGVMDLDPSITIKTPATVRARTLMYPSADGRLTRNDTRQGMLELEAAKDVSTVTDIRSVNAARA